MQTSSRLAPFLPRARRPGSSSGVSHPPLSRELRLGTIDPTSRLIPALAIAIGFLFLLHAEGASAQALGKLLGTLQGGAASAPTVSEEAKREAIGLARHSFAKAARETADRVVDGAAPGRLPQSSIAPQIEAQTRAFVDSVEDRLIAAEGDGILSRSELTAVLAEEREEKLDRLSEVLRAAIDDASPPPLWSDSESWTGATATIARYTLLERNASWRWALGLGLLVGGLVLAGVAARILTWLAEGLDGHGARRAAQAAQTLSGPFYLAAAAIAVPSAVAWIWLPVGVAEVVRRASSFVIAVSMLWIGWNLADAIARSLSWAAARTRGAIDQESTDLMRKGLRIGVIAAFAAFAANALLGVDLSSIFATIGVIGIVASIAAQDTLRNMMGALTVYGDRPFAVGDLIRIKGFFGSVEEIGFRSTRIRTLEGHRVIVPNAEVVREPVENVSARPSVRHHYSIDIVYSTPPDTVRRAVEILREILTESDHPEDQPPHVSFEDLGPYSLRLTAWYYSDTSDYWEARAHRSEVNATVLERFTEEGIEFAFPTQSIALTRGSECEASEEDA